MGWRGGLGLTFGFSWKTITAGAGRGNVWPGRGCLRTDACRPHQTAELSRFRPGRGAGHYFYGNWSHYHGYGLMYDKVIKLVGPHLGH